MEPSANIRDIVTKAIEIVVKDNYCKSYLRCLKWTYRHLEHFCNTEKIKRYTKDIGDQFITEMSVMFPNLSTSSLYKHNSAIRRLNCILQGTDWEPVFEKIPKAYASSCFNDMVDVYSSYLQLTGKSAKDVRCRLHLVSKFLRYADNVGCRKLGDITAETIFGAFQVVSDKHNFRRCVRPFLLYAYKYEFINEDLGLIIPNIPKAKHLPAVYTPEEVEQLLLVPNRSTSIGKRNYAILLIAARLGIRSCDIAAITFECLRYDRNTIDIIQSKTGKPLSLPLVDGIKEAINDYVQNGRGSSNNTHVFLRMRGYGSVDACTIQNIVRNSYRKSKIDIGMRSIGSHSLRSSLATALVDEGNDYAVVQKILGHSETNSTKSYVRMNTELLRSNALGVPAPTGNFERFLIGGQGL
jgi:site-specific recombinase XerD